MMLNLYTESFFDGAHYIEGYDGKCATLHGHTWKLCVWVRGDESLLDENGILWDFAHVKRLCERYDHKNLNEVMAGNPTAERIVLEIYHTLKGETPELFFKVRVYENISCRESYCEVGDFA